MKVIVPTEEQPKQGEWKSATTISTIAVQAEPHTTIVVAMLKSIGYVELRIDEMKPKLLEIGTNLAETSFLLNSHTDLFSRLMSKQQQVEELLTRAHDLVTQQTEQDDVVVYEAMADGLSIAWRELSRQLELRGYILTDTHAFYKLAERHEQLNNHTNLLLQRALGGSEAASNGSQVSNLASDMAGIVRATQQAINELIGITASAVDIGSSIISQIRVVGSLADNAERANEVVDACLTIEKVMLKMARQWEIIDNFWAAERNNLETLIVVPLETAAPASESSKHLQAHMNAAEAWLSAAKQTFRTMEATPEAANQLLVEVKNQKEKLQKLNVTKHTDLAHRHAKLLRDFDGFALSLEEITQLSSRTQQFLQNADTMMSQLTKMAGELINANAAIAGELGPLAHQKAGALIDEGEHLLSLETNEHVAQKVEELKARLTEVERMARERIALAKTSNQKLQSQLSALNTWLNDVAEAFLSHNGGLGGNYQSCVDFLSKHREFAADVMNKEQDVVSILGHSQELAAADRQVMAELQKKYEQLRNLFENRFQLGRNFEQILKFSKELDSSFVTLSNLLSSSNQSNFATHDSIGQQIRNLIQLVHETLQQKRHLGDKFLADARSVINQDVHLSTETAIQTVQSSTNKHENNLIAFSQRWEDWEKSRFEIQRALQTIEEVQMWQVETQAMMRVVETQIQQQLLRRPEDRQQAVGRLLQASEQAHMQRQRLQQNEHYFNQQIVGAPLNSKFSQVEQQQRELEQQLKHLGEQVTRSTVEEIFIETKETFQAPIVVSNLQDAQVEEGCRFEFSTKIDGTPEPKVSWTKDTLDVQNNADYRTSFLNGVATLTIEETFIEDSAVYNVKAENSFGSAESSAKLVVMSKSQLAAQEPQQEDGEKPRFIKQLQNTIVNEGETATIDCVLVATPEPKVIWFKEEQVIQESERLRLLFRGDHCILSILGINPQDSGLYMVKALNAAGESTNFCRINVVPAAARKLPPKTPPKPATPTINASANVQYQPKAPYLQPSLANQIVNEGDKVVFQIHVGGSPPPHVSWSFQDRAIPPQDSNFQIVNEADGWTRLIVERADPNYAGIYMVVATNDSGESRSGASLNVLPSGSGMGALFSSVQEANNNQSTTHESATTNAQQQFIRENFINTSSGYVGTPTPPPPVPRHRSEHIIIGEYVDKDMGDMGYSSIANAPEFIRPFQNEYTVDEGEKVKIDCLMVGNPRPRVNWFFNDRPIKSNYQIVELTNIGDTYSISFTPAKLENAGYYRMCAENIRGKTESLTLIHVRPRSMIPQPMPKMLKKTQSYEHQRLMDDFYGQPQQRGRHLGTPPPPKRAHPIEFPPSTTPMATSYYEPKHNFATDYNKQLQSHYHSQQQRSPTTHQSKTGQKWGGEVVTSDQPPHFSQTLVSVVGTVGEIAKFEAVVTGWPSPTPQWTKDGMALSKETNPETTFSNIGGRLSLVFPSVRLENAGKYMCTARNSSGVATSSAQLVVRPRIVAPDFTKRLISEEVMEGDTLKWSVQINGDPEPNVTWLRDGQLIPNCEEVKLVREGKGIYSMIIARVEAADGGQFTCLLENEAGEARSTADLVVRPKGSQPGSYFHITKVTQEKQLKGEEVSRNQTFSIENPRLHTDAPDS